MSPEIYQMFPDIYQMYPDTYEISQDIYPMSQDIHQIFKFVRHLSKKIPEHIFVLIFSLVLTNVQPSYYNFLIGYSYEFEQ